MRNCNTPAASTGIHLQGSDPIHSFHRGRSLCNLEVAIQEKSYELDQILLTRCPKTPVPAVREPQLKSIPRYTL